jgi:hypothetical protein
MSASYTKLRNGDWGIKVQGKVEIGAKVNVRKKSGEEKIETVTAIVFEGGGVCICAIAANQTEGRSRNVCGECGRPGKLVQDLEDGIMKHYGCCDIPPQR